MILSTIDNIPEISNKISIARKKSKWKMIKRDWRLYVILAIPMALLTIFSYLPMVGILMAFQEFDFRKGYLLSPWIGLKYFKMFIASPLFWQLLLNTIYISVYSFVAGFFVPIILAIVVNEIRNSFFRKTVQLVTYAPYFISTVVMVGIILQLLSPRTGLVNQLIVALDGNDINFMGDSSLFRHIYVWSGVWQGAGYGSIIYIAALAGIDPELYQAATIDGATKFQRLRHIDIPGISPTIVILLILSIGGILGVGFEKIYLMQNLMNLRISEVISTYVYKVGIQQSQYSFSASVGFFNSVASFILLLIANFIARRVSEVSLW